MRASLIYLWLVGTVILTCITFGGSSTPTPPAEYVPLGVQGCTPTRAGHEGLCPDRHFLIGARRPGSGLWAYMSNLRTGETFVVRAQRVR